MTNNGIGHFMGAPYHPATNGRAKRMVQTANKFLWKQENQAGSLQAKLARFLLGYRNTPHPDTGHSSAFLLMGRPLRSMLDLLKPDSSVPGLKGPLPTVRFSVCQTALARDYSVHGEKWLKGVITQRLGHYLFLLKVGDYLI